MENEKTDIIIMGLGPGDPSLITRKAWSILLDVKELYLRTKFHPAIPSLPGNLSIHSFDDLYDRVDSFSEVYDQISENILRLGQRPEGVVYAVPGHPFVAETTSVDICKRARESGLSTHIVDGISFIEPTLTALEIDPFPQLSLVDALELATKHVPTFPPDVHVLIGQIHSIHVASEVKLTLMEMYPDDYPVKLIHNAGTEKLYLEEVPLYKIDHSVRVDLFTSLYIPPVESGTSFESFHDVIAHLRAPDGCPWDREQTHLSLRSHLLEETYETLNALDQQDLGAMQEEFGDLLLQIVLHAQIANENGEFTMWDVIKGINDKIIRRHPHVFGDVLVDDVEQVLINWETFKAEERNDHRSTFKSALDGVAYSLPALAQAEQYQIRANRAGVKWPEDQRILNEIRKIIEVIFDSQDADHQDHIFGDLLFKLTLLASSRDIDTESALRSANKRFRSRFTKLEPGIHGKGEEFHDFPPDLIWKIWQ